MKITHRVTRIIAGALLSSGLAVAGTGLAPGTAQASCNLLGQCSHQWCPGDPLPVGGSGMAPDVKWDMNVCHTWYYGDVGHIGSTDGQLQVGTRIVEGEPSRVP